MHETLTKGFKKLQNKKLNGEILTLNLHIRTEKRTIHFLSPIN